MTRLDFISSLGFWSRVLFFHFQIDGSFFLRLALSLHSNLRFSTQSVFFSPSTKSLQNIILFQYYFIIDYIPYRSSHLNSYLMRYHRDTVVDFAGVVLWFHVAMSYAINSPAVYTTMDDWSLSAHTSTATTSIATTSQHTLRLGGSRPAVVLDQLFLSQEVSTW